MSPGEELFVIGPSGRRRRARVLDSYQSTGRVTTIWLDLFADLRANPANWETSEWPTRVLVLTERGAQYFDLWGESWQLETDREARLTETTRPRA